MSKHRLIVEEDYDFLCYGLSCHIKDYRVAWHLNQSLKFNCKRSQLEIHDRSGEAFEYATFVHRDPKSHLRFILINNFS
ncbi:MAG TPA: IPExxxVDY family protein, partial [Flavobacteriales bacterium]|nr:IPExxxVDY family protein [Flavobacteriales bacterium]